MPAGYHYGAKLRIAPTGLSPANTAASLAAPCHIMTAKPVRQLLPLRCRRKVYTPKCRNTVCFHNSQFSDVDN